MQRRTFGDTLFASTLLTLTVSFVLFFLAYVPLSDAARQWMRLAPARSEIEFWSMLWLPLLLVGFIVFVASWFIVERVRDQLSETDVQSVVQERPTLSTLHFKHDGTPPLFPEDRPVPSTGDDFRMQVAATLSALTPYRTEVAGSTVKVYKGERLFGVVLCMYSRGVIDAPLVRKVHTARVRMGAPVAYIVTTGSFATTAEEAAFELNIRLVDGDQFEFMRQQALRSPRFAPR